MKKELSSENIRIVNSKVAMRNVVLDYYRKACMIPEDWFPLITDIIDRNLEAISRSCGGLELVYRRTLMHYEELKELDEKRKAKLRDDWNNKSN